MNQAYNFSVGHSFSQYLANSDWNWSDQNTESSPVLNNVSWLRQLSAYKMLAQPLSPSVCMLSQDSSSFWMMRKTILFHSCSFAKRHCLAFTSNSHWDTETETEEERRRVKSKEITQKYRLMHFPMHNIHILMVKMQLY